MSHHEVPIAVLGLDIITEILQASTEAQVNAFKLIFREHLGLLETFRPLL
jgi:hypothetical protein